ncbi:hypothetical protein [Mesorhizobium sp.]|uniref:hypothetical protein n=1 Tax=Mesorhizobium sp. TaxID=1871066 RepID=UPI000FE924BB|nr:hypothetical protein [Mesorhizobium sp.]RWP32670.1 MAG: hypothetical protein EOR03_20090 [Mesorhizobium sp.]RWQ49985.1 MAG: hypothetical protein EOS84_23115 [Mesorhizobium sp.]
MGVNSFSVGATTTSSVIAGKVCFQEAAKPISTAEMGREPDMRRAGAEREPSTLLRPALVPVGIFEPGEISHRSD